MPVNTQRSVDLLPFGANVFGGDSQMVMAEAAAASNQDPYGVEMLRGIARAEAAGVLACVYGITSGSDESVLTSGADDRTFTRAELLPAYNPDIASLN